LVPRPRLIERLNAGLHRKLTLISAPAGYGKTTLLSEWVHGMEAEPTSAPRIAWLSLDEGDNDPSRFLAYLIAALQTIAVNIGDDVPGGLPQSAPLEEFLAGLINQIDSVPKNILLVLDDYHLIAAQPIHDAVTFPIDHLPDNVHLAIATRADPPLPIARLRGRGQLTDLRLSDLRFVLEEAAEFLNRVMALKFTADDVAALESRTEGWIAGLQMAAIALRTVSSVEGDTASLVEEFTGDNRFILDYLIAEVLQHQPGHIQAFLLQTSILDRLCTPLGEAVAVEVGDQGPDDSGQTAFSAFHLQPQGILEYLDRANLFVVPLDDRREWYRYHRLFADLLRARLQRAHPDMVPVLHRRASRWHEQHGLMNEAIDHALAAHDLDRAADLLEQNAEATLMRGEAATFLRWVGTLPDELVRARPTLCFYHAWMDLMYGRPLKIVESRLEEAQRGGEVIAGGVTALRGLIAAFRGELPRAIELSHRALQQLPEEDQFVRTFTSWILRISQLASGRGAVDTVALDDALRMSQRAGNVMVAIMILCNQAELQMQQGQLHRAAATYRRALDLGTGAQGRRLPITGQALIGLGELLREWNDLGAAERYLVEGIRLTEQWTEVGPFDAYIFLARVRQAQGDLDGVWEAIRKARDLAVQFDLTDLDDLAVALSEARMRVAQGDLEAAQRWAEKRDLYKYIDTPLREEAGDSYDIRLRKYELVVLARLLVASERPHEALMVLEALVPIAEWRGRPGMLIEIHVLKALAYRAQGDIDQAMKAFECALSLAAPEGYVRTLADEGEPVVELLREAAVRGIATDYVSELLAAMGVEVQRRKGTARVEAPSDLVEPLTEREMEVLRLLNTHLSSAEIAERLYVSVNTARFHIKNIYGKLGVHRRSDAVQRARDLTLF